MGVDIGTTSVKVVAFSSSGEVLAQRPYYYEMSHPEAGWAEQDPDEICYAVYSSINAVYQELKPSRPLSVSFSSAMHSIMAVDGNGLPLTGCIIWADNRAVSFAESFRETESGKSFYQITGVPIHSMSPFCKLVWIRENQPEIFQQAARFIGIKEYVFFRMTGKYVVDTGLASATGMLRLSDLKWDDQILSFIGLKSEQLSDVVSNKEIFPLPEQIGVPDNYRLEIPAGTPLVIGSSDGACANISIGSASGDAMVVTVGTSSAIRVLSKQRVIDPEMRTFCYHARNDQFITGGGGNSGAVVLEWLKDSLMESGESMDEFLGRAAEIRPGSDGLIFLPYILGERAPIWNAHAKGVFFGLTVNHTRSHMIRAAIEAVVYGIFSIGKILTQNNPINEIYATGGFARNALWVQILADVFGLPVIVNGSSESSAWGAVLIGMEALGIHPDFIQKKVVQYLPDNDRHEIYAQRFTRFERLYGLLKEEFVGD